MRWLWLWMLALLPSIPAMAETTVRGSGVLKQETRPLAACTEVSVSDALHAELSVGSPLRLTVSGDDNLLPLVRTEVQGQRLVISMRSHGSIDTRQPLVVRIALPRLGVLLVQGAAQAEVRGQLSSALQVEVSGASRLAVSGLGAAELTSTVQGSSQITLSGRIKTLKATISGASGLLARELTADAATVSAEGASRIEVCASQRLEVSLSGASHADGYCHPAAVEKKVTGMSGLRLH